MNKQEKEAERGHGICHCSIELQHAKLAPGGGLPSLIARVQTPVVPSTYCVTMCQLLNLSELESASQQNSTYILGLPGALNEMTSDP